MDLVKATIHLCPFLFRHCHFIFVPHSLSYKMFFIIFSILIPWVACHMPLCLKSGICVIIFKPSVLDGICNPLLELRVIDQDFILARTELIEDRHQVLISKLL